MLHLYWGTGKGKTTAAIGLAVRALGHGQRVTVVKFLKDGTSGEVEPLRRLGAAVYACPNAKFTWLMSDTEKRQARAAATAVLKQALAQPCDLLVLDEGCDAWEYDLIDRALLRQTLEHPAPGCEMALTGHNPADWMQTLADYNTEFTARRHPYEKGTPARAGIEF